MPEKLHQLLLIEDNPGDAELVRQMLLEAENAPFSLVWTQSLLAGLDRLAQGDIGVVLLDVSLPDSHGIESITSVRMHAPGVAIVLLTGYDSQTLAASALQSGAQDYLVKGSLDSDRLVRALRYSMMRQRSQAAAIPAQGSLESGRLIGFLGAKGGVGTTTIACHTAAELRKQSGEPVLFADLDLFGGSATMLMRAESPYSVVEAAANVHRLDLSFCKTMVSRGADAVDVLPAPGPLRVEEPVNTDRLRLLLRFIKSQYPWAVVDLGRLNPASFAMLRELGELHLVSTCEVPALYDTKLIARKLLDGGIIRESMRLLLNRMAKDPEMSPQEIEDLVGLPVSATLPNNYHELQNAFCAGKLLGERTVLRRAIGALAAKIAGFEEKRPERRFALQLPFLSAGVTRA